MGTVKKAPPAGGGRASAPSPDKAPAPTPALAASMASASGSAAFEPTVEMMVDDYDDERTLDEEEALAAGERHDPEAELSSLRRESDMPLEELLERYYGASGGAGTGGGAVAAPVGEAPVEGPASTSASAPAPAPAEEAAPDDEGARGASALRRLYRDEPSAEPGRFLRSVSRPPSEEEDDCDYSPEEEDWKKTIMVGSDYQAWIPEGLCSYDDALPYENEDKLLWNPSALGEAETEEYMAKARALAPVGLGVAAIPTGDRPRDDEQALFLLQQCGHNVEEALRRRRISAADAPQARLGLWSEEECRNFENGLKAHGKDFRMIHQNRVRTRSVGELVQFYYIWKKTERHDVFANKARLDKKKYTLHPGHADYMDRFLEDQDGGRDSPGSRGAPEAPPDPLAVGPREVFAELRRPSPTLSRSPDAEREASPTV